MGATFGADLTHGLVNDALNVVRIGIGVARFDVLNGALKHPPADGIFDEFREVALFHAPSAQKGTQSEIGLLRDLDVPADSFFSHFDTYTFRQINAYTPIVRRVRYRGKAFRVSPCLSSTPPTDSQRCGLVLFLNFESAFSCSLIRRHYHSLFSVPVNT